MTDWVTAPWATDFVTRAAVELVLIGVLGGVLGVFVVVRGMAYTVEAFSHTVFPGAVLAAAAGGSIVVGGAIAGVAAAIGITMASRSATTGDDTAIGVVFTGMFALGAVLASTLGPLDRDIASFLFGSLLGVTTGDLVVTAVATVVLVGGVVALRRPLIASAFDRDSAGLSSRRIAVLDAAVLIALALGVVVSVRAIGNVLVLALFVTPAATARLITSRLGPMIIAAVGFGVASGIGGLYVSFHADVAAGGSVVLVATALLCLTWFVSPRAGLLASVRRLQAARPAPR